MQFTDYQKFVKMPSIIIRNGGQTLTYARNSKPQSNTQTIEPQPQDSEAFDQEQTLDVTDLTFDQAVEAVG